MNFKENIEFKEKKKNYLNVKRRKSKSKNKAGRKTNNIKPEYSHTKNDFDNIQAKIQVHFLNFLIDLSNDALLTEKGNKYNSFFKHINYQYKRNIKYNYVKSLKSKSIKNILQNDINKKYKTLDKQFNHELLKKICLESKWLDKFFNITFLMAFKKYYYNEGKMIKKIHFEGKDIILSDNTKCFFKLIEKYEDLKEKLIDIAKKVYINNYKFETS